MSLALFAIACVRPPHIYAENDTDPLPVGSPIGESQPDNDSGSGADSGADPRCPDRMVWVSETTCIDRYEVVVDGDPGHADQFQNDDLSATSRSEPGVEPTEGVTFSQAMAVCASSGFRLAGSSEWEDAGDGQIGEGGWAYPYGDAWDSEACVTQDGGHDRIAPTGSHPGCVARSGADDLVGNLWEWTAAEGVVDIDDWLDRHGLFEVDGYLGASTTYELKIASETTTLELDDSGRLVAEANERTIDQSRYLTLDNRPLDSSEDVLPFRFVIEDDRAYLQVAWEADGHPAPDKRGCAFYTGDPTTCTLSKAAVASHFHDFDGSIGFRCAATPD